MSYNIVLGDLGPTMPMGLTDNGAPFVLQVSDVVVLRYFGPDKVTRQVALTITSAATGAVEAAWVAGDLPVVGPYQGQVKVTRGVDTTFPRTFPNDSQKVIWWVHVAI